jgi:hypothetical protein
MPEASAEEILEAVGLLTVLDPPKMRTSELIRAYTMLSGYGNAQLALAREPFIVQKIKAMADEIDRRIPAFQQPHESRDDDTLTQGG